MCAAKSFSGSPFGCGPLETACGEMSLPSNGLRPWWLIVCFLSGRLRPTIIQPGLAENPASRLIQTLGPDPPPRRGACKSHARHAPASVCRARCPVLRVRWPHNPNASRSTSAKCAVSPYIMAFRPVASLEASAQPIAVYLAPRLEWLPVNREAADLDCSRLSVIGTVLFISPPGKAGAGHV